MVRLFIAMPNHKSFDSEYYDENTGVPMMYLDTYGILTQKPLNSLLRKRGFRLDTIKRMPSGSFL